jgi:outer membrane protein assembly factor BamB
MGSVQIITAFFTQKSLYSLLLINTFMKKHIILFLVFFFFILSGCSNAVFLTASQRFEQEGDELVGADRENEAVLAYHQAVSSDPDNRSARIKLASRYFQQGRTRESVVILSHLTDAEKSQLKTDGQVVNPENLEHIKLSWIKTPAMEIPSGIAADEEMVATSYTNGQVFGMKLQGGESIWSQKLGETISAPPAISSKSIIVCSESGKVTALDRSSGRVIWDVQLPGAIYADLLVIGPTGYVGSYKGTMTAINLTDGEILWQLDTGGPILAGAMEKDGILYFGTSIGSVYALDISNGKLQWEKPVQLSGGIESTPVLTENRLVIGTNDSRLYSLDLNGKDYYWSYSTTDSIYASSLVEASNVYLFSIGQSSAAVDLASGESIWEQELPVAVKNTPVINNSVIYFAGTTQPFLYEMDVTSGKITGKANTGDWIEIGPIEAGGYLLLAGKDGSILAYKFKQD